MERVREREFQTFFSRLFVEQLFTAAVGDAIPSYPSKRPFFQKLLGVSFKHRSSEIYASRNEVLVDFPIFRYYPDGFRFYDGEKGRFISRLLSKSKIDGLIKRSAKTDSIADLWQNTLSAIESERFRLDHRLDLPIVRYYFDTGCLAPLDLLSQHLPHQDASAKQSIRLNPVLPAPIVKKLSAFIASVDTCDRHFSMDAIQEMVSTFLDLLRAVERRFNDTSTQAPKYIGLLPLIQDTLTFWRAMQQLLLSLAFSEIYTGYVLKDAGNLSDRSVFNPAKIRKLRRRISVHHGFPPAFRDIEDRIGQTVNTIIKRDSNLDSESDIFALDKRLQGFSDESSTVLADIYSHFVFSIRLYGSVSSCLDDFDSDSAFISSDSAFATGVCDTFDTLFSQIDAQAIDQRDIHCLKLTISSVFSQTLSVFHHRLAANDYGRSARLLALLCHELQCRGYRDISEGFFKFSLLFLHSSSIFQLFQAAVSTLDDKHLYALLQGLCHSLTHYDDAFSSQFDAQFGKDFGADNWRNSPHLLNATTSQVRRLVLGHPDFPWAEIIGRFSLDALDPLIKALAPMFAKNESAVAVIDLIFSSHNVSSLGCNEWILSYFDSDYMPSYLAGIHGRCDDAARQLAEHLDNFSVSTSLRPMSTRLLWDDTVFERLAVFLDDLLLAESPAFIALMLNRSDLVSLLNVTLDGVSRSHDAAVKVLGHLFLLRPYCSDLFDARLAVAVDQLGLGRSQKSLLADRLSQANYFSDFSRVISLDSLADSSSKSLAFSTVFSSIYQFETPAPVCSESVFSHFERLLLDGLQVADHFKIDAGYIGLSEMGREALRGIKMQIEMSLDLDNDDPLDTLLSNRSMLPVDLFWTVLGRHFLQGLIENDGDISCDLNRLFLLPLSFSTVQRLATLLCDASQPFSIDVSLFDLLFRSPTQSLDYCLRLLQQWPWQAVSHPALGLALMDFSLGQLSRSNRVDLMTSPRHREVADTIVSTILTLLSNNGKDASFLDFGRHLWHTLSLQGILPASSAHWDILSQYPEAAEIDLYYQRLDQLKHFIDLFVFDPLSLSDERADWLLFVLKETALVATLFRQDPEAFLRFVFIVSALSDVCSEDSHPELHGAMIGFFASLSDYSDVSQIHSTLSPFYDCFDSCISLSTFETLSAHFFLKLPLVAQHFSWVLFHRCFAVFKPIVSAAYTVGVDSPSLREATLQQLLANFVVDPLRLEMALDSGIVAQVRETLLWTQDSPSIAIEAAQDYSRMMVDAAIDFEDYSLPMLQLIDSMNGLFNDFSRRHPQQASLLDTLHDPSSDLIKVLNLFRCLDAICQEDKLPDPKLLSAVKQILTRVAFVCISQVLCRPLLESWSSIGDVSNVFLHFVSQDTTPFESAIKSFLRNGFERDRLLDLCVHACLTKTGVSGFLSAFPILDRLSLHQQSLFIFDLLNLGFSYADILGAYSNRDTFLSCITSLFDASPLLVIKLFSRSDALIDADYTFLFRSATFQSQAWAMAILRSQLPEPIFERLLQSNSSRLADDPSLAVADVDISICKSQFISGLEANDGCWMIWSALSLLHSESALSEADTRSVFSFIHDHVKNAPARLQWQLWSAIIIIFPSHFESAISSNPHFLASICTDLLWHYSACEIPDYILLYLLSFDGIQDGLLAQFMKSQPAQSVATADIHPLMMAFLLSTGQDVLSEVSDSAVMGDCLYNLYRYHRLDLLRDTLLSAPQHLPVLFSRTLSGHSTPATLFNIDVTIAIISTYDSELSRLDSVFSTLFSQDFHPFLNEFTQLFLHPKLFCHSLDRVTAYRALLDRFRLVLTPSALYRVIMQCVDPDYYRKHPFSVIVLMVFRDYVLSHSGDCSFSQLLAVLSDMGRLPSSMSMDHFSTLEAGIWQHDSLALIPDFANKHPALFRHLLKRDTVAASLSSLLLTSRHPIYYSDVYPILVEQIALFSATDAQLFLRGFMSIGDYASVKHAFYAFLESALDGPVTVEDAYAAITKDLPVIDSDNAVFKAAITALVKTENSDADDPVSVFISRLETGLTPIEWQNYLDLFSKKDALRHRLFSRLAQGRFAWDSAVVRLLIDGWDSKESLFDQLWSLQKSSEDTSLLAGFVTSLLPSFNASKPGDIADKSTALSVYLSMFRFFYQWLPDSHRPALFEAMDVLVPSCFALDEGVDLSIILDEHRYSLAVQAKLLGPLCSVQNGQWAAHVLALTYPSNLFLRLWQDLLHNSNESILISDLFIEGSHLDAFMTRLVRLSLEQASASPLFFIQDTTGPLLPYFSRLLHRQEQLEGLSTILEASILAPHPGLLNVFNQFVLDATIAPDLSFDWLFDVLTRVSTIDPSPEAGAQRRQFLYALFSTCPGLIEDSFLPYLLNRLDDTHCQKLLDDLLNSIGDLSDILSRFSYMHLLDVLAYSDRSLQIKHRIVKTLCKGDDYAAHNKKTLQRMMNTLIQDDRLDGLVTLLLIYGEVPEFAASVIFGHSRIGPNIACFNFQSLEGVYHHILQQVKHREQHGPWSASAWAEWTFSLLNRSASLLEICVLVPVFCQHVPGYLLAFRSALSARFNRAANGLSGDLFILGHYRLNTLSSPLGELSIVSMLFALYGIDTLDTDPLFQDVSSFFDVVSRRDSSKMMSLRYSAFVYAFLKGQLSALDSLLQQFSPAIDIDFLSDFIPDRKIRQQMWQTLHQQGYLIDDGQMTSAILRDETWRFSGLSREATLAMRQGLLSHYESDRQQLASYLTCLFDFHCVFYSRDMAWVDAFLRLFGHGNDAKWTLISRMLFAHESDGDSPRAQHRLSEAILAQTGRYQMLWDRVALSDLANVLKKDRHAYRQRLAYIFGRHGQQHQYTKDSLGEVISDLQLSLSHDFIRQTTT